MLISIIIPTYNAREHLSQTLHYIIKQEISSSIEIEVVIVDDGSIDASNEIVEEYKNSIEKLVYIYRPRDELSCRARTRNLGIENSSGDVLIFLDSGMLIPTFFVQKVADYYVPMDNKILCHYMLGAFTDPEKVDMSIIEGISSETLPKKCEKLLSFPEWLDVRHGLFDLVDDNLDRLSAPWTMGYSGAFTVPRHLIEKAGGFDDTFQGWGSEDNDFAYRLFLEGGSFLGIRDAYAFHIPYVSAAWDQKQVTNFANRKKLHRKKYRLETELYPYYPGTYYNQVLARFDCLVLSHVVPNYPSSLLRDLNELLGKARNSLLIGIDSLAVAQQIQTSHIFSHNKPTFHRFREYLTGCKVEYLLGCDTPYQDDYFDIVVVSDFFRMLNSLLQKEMLKELQRISNKIVLIYSDYTPAIHRIDENPWSNLSDLQKITDEIKLNMNRHKLSDKFSLAIIQNREESG